MAGLNGLGGKKGERGDEGARGKEGKEGEAGNTFLPWVIKDNPKIKCNECVFMSVDDGWGDRACALQFRDPSSNHHNGNVKNGRCSGGKENGAINGKWST